jgi:hypothetical protein
MASYQSKDEKMSHTDEYYEELASEEEVYLEEGVEKFRETKIAVTEVQASSPINDEQREQAAEALITGDSDDRPLSEEEVAKLLSPGMNAQRQRAR